MHESLEEFFENRSLEFSSACVSETSLKAKVSESIDQFIKEKRRNNLKLICNQIYNKISNLPALKDILQATQLNPLD